MKGKTSKTKDRVKRTPLVDKAKCPSATPMTKTRRTRRNNLSSRGKPIVSRRVNTSNFRTPTRVLSKVDSKKKKSSVVKKQPTNEKNQEKPAVGGSERAPFPSVPKRKRKRKLYENVKSR